MGRPVCKNGQPHPQTNPDLLTRTNKWHDCTRIRHWVDRNSVKMYNEQNVLRFELTMNDPTKFQVYRKVEGKENSEKKLLPMRKGISDIWLRAKISSQRIRCFTEHMATVTEPTSVGELLEKVREPVISQQGKRYRALDVTGKDLELLQAIADPKYAAGAMTNKLLRDSLADTKWAKGFNEKQLSGRVSRHLRLLREHGLIRRVPKRHQYELTEKGRQLTTALTYFLNASIDDLVKQAAA